METTKVLLYLDLFSLHIPTKNEDHSMKCYLFESKNKASIETCKLQFMDRNQTWYQNINSVRLVVFYHSFCLYCTPPTKSALLLRFGNEINWSIMNGWEKQWNGMNGIGAKQNRGHCQLFPLIKQLKHR